MKLYIDGDALPNLIKPILVRTIKRLNIETLVVSNKKITLGSKSCNIFYKIVGNGIDEADNYISELTESRDVVITADIPLADRVVSKNAFAIDHRGELYHKGNIKEYLAIRNLMETIRDSGELTKGPAPFTKKRCS